MRRNYPVFSATALLDPRRTAHEARLMQLTADNLACSAADAKVFAGLNFSLSGGEALVVTGRNGAGKSSLLRMIAGLVSHCGRATRR